MVIRPDKNDSVFADLLFQILAMMVVMFILALLLINPIAKNAEVKKVANLVARIEWNKEIDCDVDFYIKDPTGKLVYFKNKSTELAHLERDDMGIKSDTLTHFRTKIQTVENAEVWTFRGKLSGKYYMSAHLYDCQNGKNVRMKFHSVVNKPIVINFELLQINPNFRILEKNTITLRRIWQEEPLSTFIIDKNYRYRSAKIMNVKLVPKNNQSSR